MTALTCRCGAQADVLFDGAWCAFCALFCVGDAPVDRLAQLEGRAVGELAVTGPALDCLGDPVRPAPRLEVAS